MTSLATDELHRLEQQTGIPPENSVAAITRIDVSHLDPADTQRLLGRLEETRAFVSVARDYPVAVFTIGPSDQLLPLQKHLKAAPVSTGALGAWRKGHTGPGRRDRRHRGELGATFGSASADPARRHALRHLARG